MTAATLVHDRTLVDWITVTHDDGDVLRACLRGPVEAMPHGMFSYRPACREGRGAVRIGRILLVRHSEVSCHDNHRSSRSADPWLDLVRVSLSDVSSSTEQGLVLGSDQCPNVFVSYSHADEEWLSRLRVHLKPLMRDGVIDVWDDSRIAAGADWLAEIRDALARASVAILLVSADFLASDFIMRQEIPPLLKSRHAGGLTIIPILVSPCLFHKTRELSAFQAVNSPTSTLIEMSHAERESTFVRVADSVAASVRQAAPTSPPLAPGTADRREVFGALEHWDQLKKLGRWVRSAEGFFGEGVYTYLLSEREYGAVPYMVSSTMRLRGYAKHARERTTTANAGIVFGWQDNPNGPSYYNLLMTGTRMLLEEVGFGHGDEYGDFRHLNEGVPFEVVDGREFSVIVRIGESFDVWVDNRPVYSIPRPSRMSGRVGVRPWRARMDCSYFEVRPLGA